MPRPAKRRTKPQPLARQSRHTSLCPLFLFQGTEKTSPLKCSLPMLRSVAKEEEERETHEVHHEVHLQASTGEIVGIHENPWEARKQLTRSSRSLTSTSIVRRTTPSIDQLMSKSLSQNDARTFFCRIQTALSVLLNVRSC